METEIIDKNCIVSLDRWKRKRLKLGTYPLSFKRT